MGAASIGQAAGDRRTVTEPTTPPPPYCATLTANLPALSPLAFTPPRAFDTATENSPPDTARINSALVTCGNQSNSGASPQVVRLAASGANVSFLAGPIILQTGTTLLIDPGVTLYASRNANEYYTGAGGSTCGTLDPASSSGCKNWITINSGSSRRAKNISIIGPGIIDGRGDALITFTDGTGVGKNTDLPCYPSCSWWDLAHQADVRGSNQNNPRMMQLNDTDNIVLYKLNLRNSPKFFVASTRLSGVTAWGLSIFSPEGQARNTDAFDPNGSDWTITRSYISVDDDNVAIKGGTVLANGAPSAQFMSIVQNYFYTGHGMSIGSETNAGVNDILVDELTIDGADNGLRIKSDRSRGGIVTGVNYNNVCMRNVNRRNIADSGALVFSAYYTPGAVGNLPPDYRDVHVHDVHAITPSTLFFVGYDATHPLNIQLDNVIVDGITPGLITASDTNVTLGPGPVNFTPSGPDVSVVNQITMPNEPPLSCGPYRFVPFVSAGIPCDTNGDGKIDRNDINAIMAARGFSVFPGDPRDVDGDGVVTVLDARACVLRCTNPQCAP
jgi:polygalacturonase